MNTRRYITAASLLLLPLIAQAHPGHAPDAGFVAGALHPFTGWDHLTGLGLAGALMSGLPHRARWPLFGGFLAVLGATHVLWLSPAEQGSGFMAGMLFVSASLVAAGMATTRLLRLTATAER